MLTRHVVQRHALLPVTFRLPNQPDIAIAFVVDTGFSGALTLPLVAIQAMQLPYEEDILANVATDEQVQTPVYTATILWDGIERDVRVLAIGRRPLLGTALLDSLSPVRRQLQRAGTEQPPHGPNGRRKLEL